MFDICDEHDRYRSVQILLQVPRSTLEGAASIVLISAKKQGNFPNYLRWKAFAHKLPLRRDSHRHILPMARFERLTLKRDEISFDSLSF
ncbi:hypothetical protein [Bradyrhizobium sp. CCBAU 051011]|uniref:hypothetical protein n=1 Tax=Bradyrhizobium sp. CCBAU 051011 TaxID=858422 RepID=UPI001379943C|nr:hypothetical protein [Bradyrhizobium sp. CCBAU 051011]